MQAQIHDTSKGFLQERACPMRLVLAVFNILFGDFIWRFYIWLHSLQGFRIMKITEILLLCFEPVNCI